ncbi:hypothetical protein ACFLQK_00240 [bacterium]
MNTVETEHKNTDTTWGDMLPLVRRAKKYVDERKEVTTVFTEPIPAGVLANKFGFTRKGEGTPDLVLAEDTSLELGHPSVPSAAIILMTREKGIVNSGSVTLIGPDIPEAPDGARLPFAQIVLLEIEEDAEPDPFDLDNLQYLMHRLPGYMTRSVPGRLWVRVSGKAGAAGISFHAVGSALLEAYRSDTRGVGGAEFVFVTSSGAAVEELKGIGAEAEILMGRHRKLALAPDGEVECSDLNCDTCEERPVCDDLKDIVIKRREMKK